VGSWKCWLLQEVQKSLRREVEAIFSFIEKMEKLLEVVWLVDWKLKMLPKCQMEVETSFKVTWVAH
jgi:hypothetical protein